MKRRSFLTGAAAVAAAGGLVCPELAKGTPWATEPEEATAQLLGPGVRAEKCLEVFAYGGIAQYESFYVVDEYGRPGDPDHPNEGWHLFADQHERVFGAECGLERERWLQPWVVDSNGVQVNLGPMVEPIRNRPDLLSRMRVFVVSHDLEPHEAAIPYMLSGMRLGNVRMAGMGAHVQRYYQERAAALRTAPFSYAFSPTTEIGTDNLRAARAVGLHPGSARPLALRVTSNAQLAELLGRGHLSPADRARVDRLVDHYANRYRLRHHTLEREPLRAPAIDDHAFALRSLAAAPEMLDVLGRGLLDPMSGASCAVASGEDQTGIAIRAATQLLTHPDTAARYVNVVDGGLTVADGGGGYDTHFSQLGTQTANGRNMLGHLAANINQPGEADSTKLDLDDTMVLVTTEFGRTPFLQEEQGTNHFPYGYVVVMFGGPVGPEQAGIVGTLGRDGVAEEFVTPAEFRAAVLAGMGIWPFSNESFAVGDIRVASRELDGLVWLNEQVLGRRA